jgi:uncharacterized Zn-binding protein involved in type VI secretion
VPAITRIGDADVAHCSGMTRAQGSSNVRVNGIGISRQGDNNTGHLLPASTLSISLSANCSRFNYRFY